MSMHPEVNRPTSIIFPTSTNTSTRVTLDLRETGAIVIVGANGSGKSRLGAWLELDAKQGVSVHRVSAQKVLEIPENAQSEDPDRARSSLLVGHNNVEELLRNVGQIDSYKRGHRWGNNPYTRTLNDYHQLLVYLFSQHNEVANQYLAAAKETSLRVEPPESKLELAKKIWENTIPHRRLQIGANKIQASTASNVSYQARDMSDGERVILYLAGECLAAGLGSIIIVDEPEIHLHKSIQARLWDRIEAERSDCVFVYLTHDLDFAATRVGAKKIVVTDFDGVNWSWSEAPSIEDLPESLVLTILGSRKPVLFVEGTSNSLDYLVYSHVYVQHTIIPIGGCENVIHAVASFSRLPNLHHIDCKGIVDKDHRTPEEIALLAEQGVFVLPYSEIENLLLCPNVLAYVSRRLSYPDANEQIAEIKVQVLNWLQTNRQRLTLSIVGRQLDRKASRFSASRSSKEVFLESVTELRSSLDAEGLLAAADAEIQHILDQQDYQSALAIIENKGLIHQINAFFGLGSKGYVEFIVRQLKHGNDNMLVDVLKAELPMIDAPTTPSVPQVVEPVPS
jgi:ABC-type lipoprotein export system ATPase subunit